MLHTMETYQEETRNTPEEEADESQDPEYQEDECQEEEEYSDEDEDDPNGTILAFRAYMTNHGRCYRCNQSGHFAAHCQRYRKTGRKYFQHEKKFSQSRDQSPTRNFPKPSGGTPSKQT